MNTYQVKLPDGTLASRKSKRIYTHAVIIHLIEKGEDKGWGTLSYAGNKDLAEKAKASFQARFLGKANKGCFDNSEFQVVEVKVAA